MEKIFIDTDVILDVLLDRKPFSKHASIILSLAEQQKLVLVTSGLTFANSYYILRKLASHKKVIEKLTLLSKLIDIIDLNKKSIILALESSFKDFEDSIQNYTAIQDNDIKMLITRNIKDYKKSELSIMTSETFLKILDKDGKANP